MITIHNTAFDCSITSLRHGTVVDLKTTIFHAMWTLNFTITMKVQNYSTEARSDFSGILFFICDQLILVGLQGL